MKIKRFPGGLHPPEHKSTAARAIELCSLPDELVIPLAQHIGAPAEPCVVIGDTVAKGQVIAQPRGFVSVPIHASSSGVVTAVEPRLHPMGRPLLAIVIKPDGRDAWPDGLEGGMNPLLVDPLTLPPSRLRDMVRNAGVVGLGGATFPTHVKLSPPGGKKIDTLILNGVECEPYLTADHRLMLEETERVLAGIDILRRILGVERVCIGIEENKPDAIAVMRDACARRDIEVIALKVMYPQGAEKQLILAVTGRQTPSGGLPMDVGVVVQNVGTAAAVADAIIHGRPLVERIATITGPALVEPKNLRIRIGTPLRHLVAECGGLREEVVKVIMGGPMMGQTQLSLDVPAIRGTSGLLLLGKNAVSMQSEGPCIRCARCVSVCPARLLPTTISAYARRDMIAEAERFNALDCIECGCCAYICPARIPLVQSIRQVKGAILAKRRLS